MHTHTGTQYVTLIESPDIEAITSVKSWGDIDLRPFNALQVCNPADLADPADPPYPADLADPAEPADPADPANSTFCRHTAGHHLSSFHQAVWLPIQPVL
jgi:hypothetical protein